MVTPHLAGLAKRLGGKKFHLIVSTNPGDIERLAKHLRAEGLTEAIPGVTVAGGAGHPEWGGAVQVPYYVLFDHTGKLVRHRKCGDDHEGADGLQMIEWVDKLLAQIPPIAVGEEPYTALADVAKQIAFKKKLAANVKQLEAEAPEAEGERVEEIKRLLERVAAWRDEEIATALAYLGTEPKQTVPALKALSGELKGTALVAPVEEKLKAMRKAPELKSALKLAAALEKTQKKLDKLKVPKAAANRGVKTFRLDDPDCRKKHEKALAREAKALRKALEGHEGLPFAQRVQEMIAKLEG